jgi:hypothetical protein
VVVLLHPEVEFDVVEVQHVDLAAGPDRQPRGLVQRVDGRPGGAHPDRRAAVARTRGEDRVDVGAGGDPGHQRPTVGGRRHGRRGDVDLVAAGRVCQLQARGRRRDAGDGHDEWRHDEQGQGEASEPRTLHGDLPQVHGPSGWPDGIRGM